MPPAKPGLSPPRSCLGGFRGKLRRSSSLLEESPRLGRTVASDHPNRPVQVRRLDLANLEESSSRPRFTRPSLGAHGLDAPSFGILSTYPPTHAGSRPSARLCVGAWSPMAPKQASSESRTECRPPLTRPWSGSSRTVHPLLGSRLGAAQPLRPGHRPARVRAVRRT